MRKPKLPEVKKRRNTNRGCQTEKNLASERISRKVRKKRFCILSPRHLRESRRSLGSISRNRPKRNLGLCWTKRPNRRSSRRRKADPRPRPNSSESPSAHECFARFSKNERPSPTNYDENATRPKKSGSQPWTGGKSLGGTMPHSKTKTKATTKQLASRVPSPVRKYFKKAENLAFARPKE